MYDWKGPGFYSDFLCWGGWGGGGLLCIQQAWVVSLFPPPPPPPPPTHTHTHTHTHTQSRRDIDYRFCDVCLFADLSETISLYPLVRFDGIKRLSIEVVQEIVLVFLSPHPPTMIMGYNNQPGVHPSVLFAPQF